MLRQLLKLQYFYHFNMYLSIFVALILNLNGALAVDYYTEKPSYISSCKIYQPEFTKCSTDSIQKLMNQLIDGASGIASLKNGLDPLKLSQLIFKQDNNEVATIRANLTDLNVLGFSKMVIKESKVSKKDFSWETKIFLPKMRIEGKYKMEGRILVLPLSGAGNMFIELESLDILMNTKTRLYEQGGFTFYNVTKVRVFLTIKRLKTNFDNLFNGKSREVERSTNEFFNENWPELFEALRPLITETVERVIFDILRKAFDVIPANFLVEDIPTSEQLYGKKLK